MKRNVRIIVHMALAGGGLLLTACGAQGGGAAAGNGGAAATTAQDKQDHAPEAGSTVNSADAAPAVTPAARDVHAVETAGLLPPGARVVPASRVEGAVAFAYRSSEAPAQIVNWYRQARSFTLTSEMDEGGEHVLSGTTAQPAGEFSIRLAPQGGGGTTAMVLVTPHR